MAEFVLFTRMQAPFTPEGSLPPPVVQGAQCAIVNADSSQEALDTAFEYGFFHGADTVWVLPVAGSGKSGSGGVEEFTITHTHEAASTA
jgi:hypothetical protein